MTNKELRRWCEERLRKKGRVRLSHLWAALYGKRRRLGDPVAERLSAKLRGQLGQMMAQLAGEGKYNLIDRVNEAAS